MKKIAFLCLLMCLCSMHAAFAASPASIRVYEKVNVAGPDIFLGDIAQIDCADDARAAALRSLKIGNAAAPGGKVVFTEDLLKIRLAAASGDYTEVVWQIPALVTVETGAQSISADTLVNLAIGFIEEQLRLEPMQRMHTVERAGMPNALLAPEGEISYQVTLPYGLKYNAPTNVLIWVYVDGQLYKKVTFRLRVHVYEQVVVTSRSLAAKQQITEADLHLENLDTSKIAAGYLTDVKKAVGLVVKRALPGGTPLSAIMLDKPVIIKRMTMINIISNVGGVEVRMEGQALQDGKEGQIIRVKNIKSDKMLNAKVVDASTVEVLSW